jgi:hypothetical protein
METGGRGVAKKRRKRERRVKTKGNVSPSTLLSPRDKGIMRI